MIMPHAAEYSIEQEKRKREAIRDSDRIPTFQHS